MNEQQAFWKETYTDEYMKRNSNFDFDLAIEAWNIILKKADKESINSVLECGSNIGRNINFLNTVLPNAKKSIIEIAVDPYNFITTQYKIDLSFNGSILESNFEKESFDLVFTNGVLIHIHPDEVINNMRKMYEYSKKYIIVSEYFNRTPTMIEYRGEMNKLFKSDFGKTFMENFDVKLIDYGFLWGHVYDNAGFDDVTFWLFEKK
jgi:pseudaminic acid biosynthesis-associated methylase